MKRRSNALSIAFAGQPVKGKPMKFVLNRKDWTDEAASLWGDLLALDRPATFEEALDDLTKNDFGGNFDDYFNADGSQKGPCTLGITVETE